VLVGLERPDDAGVYRLTDELALVQTVDFFTPVVDDPLTFGRIAAANALSDVYAMGAEPSCALNIACFPAKTTEIEVLREILRGGMEKAAEAGVPVIGGHTIEAPELAYGMSVTGLVHPARILTKRGGRPGDKLILTKPLGTGVINTAVKAGCAPEESVRACVASMLELNRAACEVMLRYSPSACTDVTGFGLAGHACEMLEGSALGMRLKWASIPLLAGAEELCARGLLPGGLHRNREFRAGAVEFAPGVPGHVRDLLFDPQTSGGLLIAVAAARAGKLLEELRSSGIARASIIGEMTAGPAGRIVVC